MARIWRWKRVIFSPFSAPRAACKTTIVKILTILLKLGRGTADGFEVTSMPDSVLATVDEIFELSNELNALFQKKRQEPIDMFPQTT